MHSEVSSQRGSVVALTEVLRDEIVAVVHDEDSAHVELDVVLLLLVLKEVKRRTAGHEEQSAELQLTLHREVLGSITKTPSNQCRSQPGSSVIYPEPL